MVNIDKTINYNHNWEARQTNICKIINNNCKILEINMSLENGKASFQKEKLDNCRINKQIYRWLFNDRILIIKTCVISKVIYK